MGVETAMGRNGRPWLPRTVRGEVAQRTDELLNLVGLEHKADRVVGELGHDMSSVFGIAQRITVLDQGRVLAEAPPRRSRATMPCAPPTSELEV